MARVLLPGVALGCLWGGTPAPAQSIGDWNGSYPAKPAAGQQAPATSPTPRIDAAPVIATTSQPEPRPRPARHPVSQPVRAHRARTGPDATASSPAPTPTPTPSPTARATPAPTESPVPPPVKLTTFPAPHRPAKPPLPTPVHAPKGQDLPQWPLGLAAVLGGVAGWALWRRKARALPKARPKEAPQDIAPKAAPPAPPPVPAAAEPMDSAPPPLLGPELTLAFVPTRFTTTLTEAILRYRLTVTNRGAAPFGPLVIAGAMEATGPEAIAPAAPAPPAAQGDRSFRPAPGFSPHPHFTPYGEEPAHADLSDEPQPLFPTRAQVSPLPASPATPLPASLLPASLLPECHRLPLLRAGEGVDFAGQMRLSLGDITPIRVGGAALLLPVVRLSMEAGRIAGEAQSGPPLVMDLCVMVGHAVPRAGDAAVSLAPLRLDGDAAVQAALATRIVPNGTPILAAH